MDIQGKVVEKGKSGSPQSQARVEVQSSDLTAMLADFALQIQVLPAMESTVGTTKAGSAPTGEESAFHAMFEESLRTNVKWQGVNDLCNRMREILHNRKYLQGDRLSPEDEMAVRDVLKYHAKSEEKTGLGIDYIKIQNIFDSNTRCFWVVRLDGSEIDFSYHQCLKEKVAKECPDLLEHYDFRYRSYRVRERARPGARRNEANTCFKMPNLQFM